VTDGTRAGTPAASTWERDRRRLLDPSRIVRAEAIAAYLWNHDNSAAARQTLSGQVRDDERIFLDRVVKRDGEQRESFNRKLSTYLKEHPEARPPAEEKSKAGPRPAVGKPPAF
jgi:hypothetical protein